MTTDKRPSKEKLPWQIHASPWIVCLLIIVLLTAAISIIGPTNVWQGWAESGDLRKSNYTERIYELETFRTRANTWSNLAYIFVGIYCIALGLYDLRRVKSPLTSYVERTPEMSLLFGSTCCYLGFASGLFHASLTRLGQQIDVGAMYSPLLACIAINLGRYLPSQISIGKRNSVLLWPVLVLAVLIASYLLFLYKWSMSSGQVLPLHLWILAVFVIVDRFPRNPFSAGNTSTLWIAIAFALLLIAVFFRQMDVAGKFGQPDWWFQGHAIWHLLTAGSLASMYLYYRSELGFSSPKA